MIVVSDTTPVNYLVQIEQQSLLHDLYGKVYVPSTVIAELCHPKSLPIVKIWAENLPGWIIVQNPMKIISLPQLDAGEREAISLAHEIGSTNILLDDLDARNIALAQGFKVTGTLGILLLAAKRQMIDIKPVLESLQKTTARISQDLIKSILEQFG